MSRIGIFWDYENIRINHPVSAQLAITTIRKLALSLGTIDFMKSYMETSLEISSQRSILRSQMQAGGITIVDTPHAGGKEVADKMIIVDMVVYCLTNPDSKIIILTNDKDFSYTLSTLRNRGHQMVVIHTEKPAGNLLASADISFDFYDLLNQNSPDLPIPHPFKNKRPSSINSSNSDPRPPKQPKISNKRPSPLLPPRPNLSLPAKPAPAVTLLTKAYKYFTPYVTSPFKPQSQPTIGNQVPATPTAATSSFVDKGKGKEVLMMDGTNSNVVETAEKVPITKLEFGPKSNSFIGSSKDVTTGAKQSSKSTMISKSKDGVVREIEMIEISDDDDDEEDAQEQAIVAATLMLPSQVGTTGRVVTTNSRVERESSREGTFASSSRLEEEADNSSALVEQQDRILLKAAKKEKKREKKAREKVAREKLAQEKLATKKLVATEKLQVARENGKRRALMRRGGPLNYSLPSPPIEAAEEEINVAPPTSTKKSKKSKIIESPAMELDRQNDRTIRKERRARARAAEKTLTENAEKIIMEEEQKLEELIRRKRLETALQIKEEIEQIKEEIELQYQADQQQQQLPPQHDIGEDLDGEELSFDDDSIIIEESPELDLSLDEASIEMVARDSDMEMESDVDLPDQVDRVDQVEKDLKITDSSSELSVDANNSTSAFVFAAELLKIIGKKSTVIERTRTPEIIEPEVDRLVNIQDEPIQTDGDDSNEVIEVETLENIQNEPIQNDGDESNEVIEEVVVEEAVQESEPEPEISNASSRAFGDHIGNFMASRWKPI